MRAVFYGTPQFAAPALHALTRVAEVALVICQPDKPKGRGLELAPPPVKIAATELGLLVAQPTKLRDGALAAQLRALDVDVALVIAYGRILPRDVLDAPRRGSLNLHASLLPKYRGAAPIAWAVANGEAETGITLMEMDEGMDTGPMLAHVRTPIGADETQGELAERLATLAAEMVFHDGEDTPFVRAVRGELSATPQPEEGVSTAPILQKSDGLLDWTMPARALHDRVRGMHPWPGGHTTQRGRGLRVHTTKLVALRTEEVPGTVLLADKRGVVVATGAGQAIELVRVQPEGKRVMSAAEWVNGRGVTQGDRLG